MSPPLPPALSPHSPGNPSAWPPRLVTRLSVHAEPFGTQGPPPGGPACPSELVPGHLLATIHTVQLGAFLQPGGMVGVPDSSVGCPTHAPDLTGRETSSRVCMPEASPAPLPAPANRAGVGSVFAGLRPQTLGSSPSSLFSRAPPPHRRPPHGCELRSVHLAPMCPGTGGGPAQRSLPPSSEASSLRNEVAPYRASSHLPWSDP